MAAPTVLGCFSLASGIDPATQTKVARLAVATAAMTLVITLATTIADIVRNGFSVMALANPVVAILLCVVGVPRARSRAWQSAALTACSAPSWGTLPTRCAP